MMAKPYNLVVIDREATDKVIFGIPLTKKEDGHHLLIWGQK